MTEQGGQTRDGAPLVEGEDFYREGAYLVFTARHHLRRGYCCESGCRHCPYTERDARAAQRGEKDEKDVG